MTTLRQLAQGRTQRVRVFRKCRREALMQCPQRRGICLKPKIMKPKKPNSAQRKVVRVQLTSRITITAAIPGEGHTLQQYSSVLVRGGRIRDLPGIQYRIIRGVYDATSVATRARGRSKYGTKLWKRKAAGIATKKV